MPLVSEMQQLYRNHTFQIIPVIIGCLRAIPKSLEQNLKKLGLEDATNKPLIKKLQKTALLGSVKIMKTFINNMIYVEVTQHRRNLMTVWLDYKKAFDSVPHSWIIEALKLEEYQV